MDNPIISVSRSYPGANADVIEKPDYRTAGAEYQRYPGIRSLSSVSQQGSSRITVEFELSVTWRQPPTMYVTKCRAPSVTCPRLRPANRIQSRCRRHAYPHGCFAKRQTLAAGTPANSRPHRKEQLQTISDVRQCKHLGRETLFHALVARPYQDVRLRHYPIDVKNAVDNEKRGTPLRQHRGNTIELTIRTPD